MLKVYTAYFQKKFKPNFLVGHLRVCLNQWCTTRRFKGSSISCPFGCGTDNDSIEHCLTCDKLQFTIHSFFNRPNMILTWHDLIFLGAGENLHESSKYYRILYCYVAHRLYNSCKYGGILSNRLLIVIMKQVFLHCRIMRACCRNWRNNGLEF